MSAILEDVCGCVCSTCLNSSMHVGCAFVVHVWLPEKKHVVEFLILFRMSFCDCLRIYDMVCQVSFEEDAFDV